MEKKKLKLKKETLTNLTNLNIKEMEELKGGVATQRKQADDLISTVSASVTVTVSWSYSWSW